MKILILTVLFPLWGPWGFSAFAQQPTIIVQDANGANPRIFYNLDSAVIHANPHDYLYIGKGTYNITSTWKGYDGLGNYPNHLVIEKPLHLVGNGYSNNSTASIIQGTVALRASASGSTITGIQFSGNYDFYLDSISDVTISRCQFTTAGSRYIFFCGTGSSVVITECAIPSGPNLANKGGIVGRNSITVAGSASYFCLISKNYFGGGIQNLNNALISNNIFYDNTFNYALNHIGTTCNNVTVTNNISFAQHNGGALNPSNSIIKNNITPVAMTQNASNTYQNNYVEATANTFVNYAGGDYHLKPTSVGVNAGTDGTDIGIYGTATPFKANMTTAYPQIPSANVAPETDAAGKLRVDITIEAQDN